MTTNKPAYTLRQKLFVSLSVLLALSAGAAWATTSNVPLDGNRRPYTIGPVEVAASPSYAPVLMGLKDTSSLTRYLYGDTTGRQIIVGAAADGAAVAGNPLLVGGQDGTNAQSLLTDTSGRPMIVGAAASNAAVAGNPVLTGGQDGTNAVTYKTGSAATAALATIAGAQMVTPAGQWSVTHAPAANTAAVASKSAGAAGVRHIAQSVSCAVASDSAPTAIKLQINLRDGATGAGTILGSWVIAIPAVAGEVRNIVIPGLNIPGTAATAMTLEYTAAGGANTFESCTLAGTDAA